MAYRETLWCNLSSFDCALLKLDDPASSLYNSCNDGEEENLLVLEDLFSAPAVVDEEEDLVRFN